MRRDNMVAFGVGPFPGSAIGRQCYVVVDCPQLELIRENAFPGLVIELWNRFHRFDGLEHLHSNRRGLEA